MKPKRPHQSRPRGKPSYVDRQFWLSFLYTALFYGTVMAILIEGSWALGPWAALAFLGFLFWAYRRSIGAWLGLCARRPGARREDSPTTPWPSDDSASSPVALPREG